jgi:hypothetical protein
VAAMLTDQNAPAGNRTQGLTWSADLELNGEHQWGHGGSDPGSDTDIRILPQQGLAAIVFTNTNGVVPTEISNRLLEIGDEIFWANLTSSPHGNIVYLYGRLIILRKM